MRDATALQIGDNAEIQHIKQILGLQHGKSYEDVKALRYGHLMIMTDQVCIAGFRNMHCPAVVLAAAAQHLCFTSGWERNCWLRAACFG